MWIAALVKLCVNYAVRGVYHRLVEQQTVGFYETL
jgi:hypothetical protein